MESFKFSEPLPEMILKGKKDITWRINNEKKVLPGDVISLCTNAGKEFAKAKVVWVKETTFRNLSREDFEGHEEFASPEEMYQA